MEEMTQAENKAKKTPQQGQKYGSLNQDVLNGNKREKMGIRDK